MIHKLMLTLMLVLLPTLMLMPMPILMPMLVLILMLIAGPILQLMLTPMPKAGILLFCLQRSVQAPAERCARNKLIMAPRILTCVARVARVETVTGTRA